MRAVKPGWANPATEVLIKLYYTHVMLGDRLAARLRTLDLDDKKFGRHDAVSTRQHSQQSPCLPPKGRLFWVVCDVFRTRLQSLQRQ